MLRFVRGLADAGVDDARRRVRVVARRAYIVDDVSVERLERLDRLVGKIWLAWWFLFEAMDGCEG